MTTCVWAAGPALQPTLARPARRQRQRA